MELTLISINALICIIFILVVFGVFESRIHKISLNKIPIRIHVNGTRGKSSVVRLIAAGLRQGGLKTFAKTTGTIPRIINDKGKDLELHRLRSATIGEQIRLIRFFGKKNPDALVIECMAVNPQYQWISERKIVKSTLSVITNVRRDHVDEMGDTIRDIAYSLSNTIPFNSKIFTSEQLSLKFLKKIALKRNSKIIKSSDSSVESSYMTKMPYLEHKENVELALSVCMEAGVKREKALAGMLKTIPDPGALLIWNLKNKNKFISAFAANDPDSTFRVWKLINLEEKNKTCFFLNSRNDRRYRTIQLIDLVLNKIKPDLFIIRADNVDLELSKNNNKIEIKKFPMKSNQNDVINYIVELNQFTIVGIGNIVGWGDEFINQLKEFKS
ncbi:poly-gamma-glutamate synthase PgsB [Candidatus Marinimicrobia bacterium]|nr:poly-gamma-glutamate synthase PgsB [Candidatus Neomarinimicrobiota bacterium]